MNRKLGILISLLLLILCGCQTNNGELVNTTDENGAAVQYNDSSLESNILSESSNDSEVDFDALLLENEDVVGWLSVSGTSIDAPILQSGISDDYYKSHSATNEANDDGAVYIEMPTMPDMCGFNSIIHGSEKLFGELRNYANPDYFEKNEEFYVFIPGNVLTYEVWASFERENNNLLDEFDFSDGIGSREFLNYVYESKIMGKQIREGFEGLTEFNYLVTLTIDEPDSDKQMVVLGVLINDAANTIHSNVVESLDVGPVILE